MRYVLPYSITKLLTDPRVECCEDERDTGDGYWLYLAPGYYDSESGIHFIHENTGADVARKFKGVKPCDCGSCLLAVRAAQLAEWDGVGPIPN